MPSGALDQLHGVLAARFGSPHRNSAGHRVRRHGSRASGPRLLTVPQPPRVADLVSVALRPAAIRGAARRTAALSVAGFTLLAERGCAVGGATMIVAADWFDRAGYVPLAIGIPSDRSFRGWSSAS